MDLVETIVGREVNVEHMVEDDGTERRDNVEERRFKINDRSTKNQKKTLLYPCGSAMELRSSYTVLFSTIDFLKSRTWYSRKIKLFMNYYY